MIVHIDPAVATTNLGDQIISEAVYSRLRELFHGERIIQVGSRDLGSWSRSLIASADLVFLGGTNALSSNPVFGYRQFAMGVLPPIWMRNVILVGVGWWQYQKGKGPFADLFYKSILNPSFLHSVRDDYTARQLRSFGIDNTLNTACPTMWTLNSYNATIEDAVLITLTDYNRDTTRDLTILQTAFQRFRTIYFWPQGLDDNNYLSTFSSTINLSRISVLPPNLSSLDETLKRGVTYIGTRLHAGIRALQHKCPAYIIPTDNRAVEIAKTESLPLLEADLGTVMPGDTFRFSYTTRPELQQFLGQFR